MCVNCGVSSCSSCNTDSYIPSNTSALNCTNASSVDSVTGLDTDNTDPENPIVQIAVDGVTITGEGTPASPLVSSGGGGGGVTSIVAGTNVTISPVGGTGAVTINSSGGGGGFVHYLGEDFGGGIIYYLYKDSGGVEHGLIVNKTESAFGIKWQNTATLTGADRTEDGAYNTALMTDSPVEVYVTGLSNGGFTDWYLPSIDELGLLYYNRYSAQKGLRAGGSTLLSSTRTYWSSTENFDLNNAQVFRFANGDNNSGLKIGTSAARAIRSF
jgi:hypothetical protein